MTTIQKAINFLNNKLLREKAKEVNKKSQKNIKNIKRSIKWLKKVKI